MSLSVWGGGGGVILLTLDVHMQCNSRTHTCTCSRDGLGLFGITTCSHNFLYTGVHASA